MNFKKTPSIFAALCLPAALLAGWQLLVCTGDIAPILLPPPAAVARRAFDLAVSGELLRHAATSTARVFTGFAISSTAALTLALALYRRKRIENLLSLLLEALRVVPPLSLIPLLILWLGIDEAPKLAIVVLASFFPIYLSALSAMRGTMEKYGELVEMLGLSETTAMLEVLLPGSARGVVTGLRLGFGYAWRALVGAELIAAASGLGYLIEDGSSLARTDQVIVGILTIAVLGILFDRLLGLLFDRLMPWERRASASSKGRRSSGEHHSTAAFVEKKRTCSMAFSRLTVTYPDAEVSPVRNLSCKIEAGRVTALLGRSGCGKTTLLKTAAGLIKPSAGLVTFSPIGRPRIAMVFQEPLLLPWKTVAENIELSARRVASAEKTAGIVREALALTGLTELADRYPKSLSGGQQQRAGLARAIAAQPDILLMDEPFAALDALTRLELQIESRRLFSSRAMTVLMITHDVREAVRMADKAMILRNGCIDFSMTLDFSYPRDVTTPDVAYAEEVLLRELLRERS